MIALWAIQIAPIVEKLTANARYDGHWARIAASRSSLAFGGRPISRTRRVIAMAKTPSLNASIRAVRTWCARPDGTSRRRVAGRAGSSGDHVRLRPPASLRPSPATARRRPTRSPSIAPSTSAAERFWLSFSFASIRVIRTSSPTIARSWPST